MQHEDRAEIAGADAAALVPGAIHDRLEQQ